MYAVVIMDKIHVKIKHFADAGGCYHKECHNGLFK